MGATTHAYIIASRITQGHEDWEASTPVERASIVEAYMRIRDDPAMQKHSDIDLLVQHESFIHSKHEPGRRHHRHHSLKELFEHRSRSAPDLLRGVRGEAWEGGHGFRAHPKDLYKHEGVPEQALSPGSRDGVPVVHSAAVRQVLKNID